MTICEELSALYAERSDAERDPAVAAQFAIAAAITAAAASFAFELRLALDKSRAVDMLAELAEAISHMPG